MAYTKECINVYVIHARVHVYPLQFFFFACLPAAVVWSLQN